MSGEQESLTPTNKKIEKQKERMEEYEQRIGLPAFPANHYECEHLSLNREQLAKLSSEECSSIAVDLANYAIYIQRLISREKSIVNWLESRINLTIANELNDYSGFYSFDQRRNVAIVNNVYAKELEEFRITSQVKVDMLDGLTYQINQLCRIISDIMVSRRQQKNY